MKTLIKTADVFGNVHYLMRGEHGWSATLANGIPYCFHQAANAYEPDEVALKFELDNTTTAEEAIEVLQRRGKRPAGQWQPTFEIMSGASVRVPDVTTMPPAGGMRYGSIHETFTEANMETAMCLWEAALELRNDDKAIKSDDTDDRAKAARALDKWFEDEGTSVVRHEIISWALECEKRWEDARAAQQEHEPYDWEHCPRFLIEKLIDREEPGPTTSWRKFEFEFSRGYTVTEGFKRVISAPSLAEAEAAAANLASEFNHDCPDDCSEMEGGSHDGSTSFDATCTSAEVHKQSEPDYVVTRDGQTVPYEA